MKLLVIDEHGGQTQRDEVLLDNEMLRQIDQGDIDVFCFKDGQFHRAAVAATDDSRSVVWQPV